MDGIPPTPKPIRSYWGKEERPRMSHEMLILRGEDGKRWVGVAPSHQTFAVLANWVKTCMRKQSHAASSGDIEFSPSPEVLFHFLFLKDLPVGKIFLTW